MLADEEVDDLVFERVAFRSPTLFATGRELVDWLANECGETAFPVFPAPGAGEPPALQSFGAGEDAGDPVVS